MSIGLMRSTDDASWRRTNTGLLWYQMGSTSLVELHQEIVKEVVAWIA